MTRARALFFLAFTGMAGAGCADILGLDPLGPALYIELPDGALVPIDSGFVPEPAPTTTFEPDPGTPPADAAPDARDADAAPDARDAGKPQDAKADG